MLQFGDPKTENSGYNVSGAGYYAEMENNQSWSKPPNAQSRNWKKDFLTDAPAFNDRMAIFSKVSIQFVNLEPQQNRVTKVLYQGMCRPWNGLWFPFAANPHPTVGLFSVASATPECP